MMWENGEHKSVIDVPIAKLRVHVQLSYPTEDSHGQTGLLARIDEWPCGFVHGT